MMFKLEVAQQQAAEAEKGHELTGVELETVHKEKKTGLKEQYHLLRPAAIGGGLGAAAGAVAGCAGGAVAGGAAGIILGPGAIATAAAGAAAGCALGAAAGTAAGVTIGGISSAIVTLYRSRKK
ncbi:unnamed protein product [Rotaria sp. Silwood2]|nr:unnamed protein product [Rotaria sp. Silwood2]CAF3263378.1 unnamed protein product [Rotaria sp. Silwood2]CAF3420274.1 unnamed protein product [Rotaria sp. Silwood2]CAF3927344.1 unnamed protein product [Rotaria sp. Silwood2]CAF4554580.1 unnamed protein product [Rotaria sp. Silwood2]